jgi:cyclophilin family peptidyl-prolyl cis-trans isomerase/HEAT repeat protein
MARLLFLPAVVMLLLGCETPDKSINKFSDPELLRIAELQDRRMADSLYAYFDHPNALYRRDAVQAFGSVQDAGKVEKIGKLLLMDGDASVRKAAAFALGQIQHPSCERILLGALVKEEVAENTFEILQSYGKTTRRWQLDPTAFQGDTLKTAGLAWSIYRAGIRGKTDSVANAVAVGLLATHHSHNTRLAAAYYFGRGATGFESAEQTLIAAARNDPSVNVRMAIMPALGKIASDTTLLTIKDAIKHESDSRVIINAVRVLKSFPYNQTKNYLYESLHHKDVHVGIAASEIIIETVPRDAWIEVSSLTNVVNNWRIQANVYEAALKAGKNKDLAREIQERYTKSNNPYERAALLGALKHFPEAYPFVEQSLRSADTAVVRSSAAAALVAMNQTADFSRQLTRQFAALYRDLLATEEDPAVLGTIAIALADSTLGYRSHFPDGSVLYSAREKLSLPEHNEALQSIEAAIAQLENRKPEPIENNFNHPIDWQLVKKIRHDQLATIQTTRGSIIVRLLVNEAPGSVANFVALSRKNYFDDKTVHRVVPNFVIQDGCKRGDGWGSENYSIRSEFSPRPYTTGSMGMASAGKDTEGTQWFITHSPTPHLAGRYTLFAEVQEGHAVVDYLQMGDKITDVEIENFTDQ